MAKGNRKRSGRTYLADRTSASKIGLSLFAGTAEEELHLAHARAIIAEAFDAEYYLRQLSDEQSAPSDPVLHYLESGWREMRDPSPEFSTSYYLESNADVRDDQVNPFVHYVEHGRKEGRKPRKPAIAEVVPPEAVLPAVPGPRFARERAVLVEEFDVEFYLKMSPDLGAGIDPIIHYLEFGWREMRDPSPEFSTSYYLETNADVRDDQVNPFVHYLEHGRKEGRQPRKPAIAEVVPPEAVLPAVPSQRFARERAVLVEEFDVEFYLKASPDLWGAGIDPIIHYLESGWREKRDPSPEFSTSYYLETNAGIREAGINPFVHYVEHGRREGRQPRKPAAEEVVPPEAALPAVPSQRFARERAVLVEEFDVEFYLRMSPDLGGAGIDPIIHYLESGWREKRDPSPEFSTSYYLETNAGIRDAGINPFVHYVEHGRREGRKPRKPAIEEVVPPEAALPAVPSQRFARERAVIAEEFDVEFYLKMSPDLRGAPIDPIIHYLESGWREMRDPSPEFSTSYYLETNVDIREGGINPFVHYIEHGKRERRTALPFSIRKTRQKYNPLVTAIVPNFNHARFLEARLDSILCQTYPNIEVLILDDCSTDNSVDVIERYERTHPKRVRSILNTANSGRVFSQWRKGIEHAKGDLIWICESDDFCELDFLEQCLRPFVDPSIMISFGRVQFADEHGQIQRGLDGYREQAEPGIWSDKVVRPASEWFRGAFGVSNVIPNVGGCVIRNQRIADQIWEEALTYRICGDWYLYAMLSNGGRISYVPTAIAYFRQHGKNTSVSGFRRAHYYAEHEKVIVALRNRWGTPDDIAVRFYEKVLFQFNNTKAKQYIGKITDHFSNDRVIASERKDRHILFAILGFHLGGGEIIPIHLANELVRRGFIVSVMCISSEIENEELRNQLDNRIAVYESDLVAEMGLENFLEKAGIDVVHSHYVGVEFFFFGKKNNLKSKIPYVVTLHGSYECTPLSDEMLLRIVRGVSHWCYLSRKNLKHLQDIPLASDRISSIGNAMPIDEREFPYSRESLGVGSTDLLFTLASRAIKEKGWRIAIEALRIAQTRSDRILHLMLCGSGPEADLLKVEFASDARVHFMGFQEHIYGAYRQSDAAILPTRFPGESFPMAVVQALQVGTPVIATDIGEIKRLVVSDGLAAGIVVPFHEDDLKFIAATADAMLQMIDDDDRAAFAATAKEFGSKYDIQRVAEQYIEIYDRECERLNESVLTAAG